MAEARELRKQDRVVRPIAAGGGRTCARPGCPALARATLLFVYDAKTARLVSLLHERDPAAYDLCTTHADRTSPPFGWSLADERPPETEDRPVDLADEDRTVAVISAALRSVPNPVASPEPGEASDVAASAPDAGPDDPEVQTAARALAAAEISTRQDGTALPSEASPQPVGRPVPAAIPRSDDDGHVQEPEPLGSVDDADTQALVAAAEQLAGAEIEVALQELTALDAVAAARVAEPEVWRVELEDDPADGQLVSLTLPFDVPEDVIEDLNLDDDFDEDAPLTPEGAAQLW